MRGGIEVVVREARCPCGTDDVSFGTVSAVCVECERRAVWDFDAEAWTWLDPDTTAAADAAFARVRHPVEEGGW